MLSSLRPLRRVFRALPRMTTPARDVGKLRSLALRLERRRPTARAFRFLFSSFCCCCITNHSGNRNHVPRKVSSAQPDLVVIFKVDSSFTVRDFLKKCCVYSRPARAKKKKEIACTVTPTAHLVFLMTLYIQWWPSIPFSAAAAILAKNIPQLFFFYFVSVVLLSSPLATELRNQI